MIKKTLSIIGAIALVLIPVIVTYYLNGINHPDVRYVLSDSIPLSFTNTTASGYENIQQLEVKNTGSLVAEKIVVNVKTKLSEYDIQKYIASDAVNVFETSNSVQFVYPSLPPQAGFKIVLKSPENITYAHISVSHNTGSGTEALSESNQSPYAYFLLIIFIIAILFYVV